MSKSPEFKVYDASGKYMAAVREIEAGAALLGSIYPGGTIRLGHRTILYHDGVDGDAGDSYDAVVDVCFQRLPYHG